MHSTIQFYHLKTFFFFFNFRQLNQALFSAMYQDNLHKTEWKEEPIPEAL